MADEPAVLFQKEGAVGRLVLNRPDVINAFNVQMRDDLYSTLEAVRDDPDIRAALITGSGGRGFCAGADLTEFGTAPSQVIARQVRWERDLWGLFGSIHKPLVAALHGYVIGSGVEIACLCDLRVAAEDAVFRMPETALGMVPAAGGSQTLPRTIGQGPAMKILLANDVLDAESALKLGLVHRVVKRDALEEASFELAERLSDIPPALSAGIKRAVADGLDMSLSRGLGLEYTLARSQALQSEGLLHPS
ncbi:MAG: enoyl-CoA hydratase/isomerase family protein [Dehalococcoidia bacterium]|nr:enoyl-CoA hydratase/isomerase family protein [Dehalococcoidia bacterium]